MSVEELLDNLREGGDGVQMSLDAITTIMRQQHHPRATFNREEMTVGEIAAILHHDDAEVQAAGCLAMSQQVKDHVGATSLWPPSLAVAALRDYPSDKQAQSYGIEMLGNVAYYYPIEQTHLVDAGAVSLIITALRQHPDDVTASHHTIER